jgi:fused signal recognition particle receptor
MKPILAAGDTFRAAAAEQLGIWGERIGLRTVAGKPGADASAVVFDAIQAARSGKAPAVIADTAGRLHTKHNLMEELRKIARTVERANGRAADEILLVLDATTGQNALSQAREFSAAVAISGLVLTKMDGTAKGGTLITIARETGLPIKAMGTGESVADLEDFDPWKYAEQLFEE